MSSETWNENSFPLGCSWVYPRVKKAKKVLKVMVIMAHPDDPDLETGGLALKLVAAGHHVRFVACTNGNMGHNLKGPIELAYIELGETQRACEVLGVEYECLNINDGHIYVNRENTGKVIDCIRRYDPDLVITHRSNDYHRDHRYTSQLVLDASYMLIVPHYFPETPIPSSRKMPVFMYAYDKFKKPYAFIPNVLLDITDVYDKKAEAVIQHTSQMMEWLPWTMSMESMVPPDYDRRMQMEVLEMLMLSVFGGILSDYRPLWKKGYAGQKVSKGEAYEICEYGTQPSNEQLKEFFPGCYIPTRQELESLASESIGKKLEKLEKKVKDLEKQLKEKTGG
ncbi:MAG TPA: PIG-L deacetylase family protein [Candidatus Lokiarchaeia archaeon]|nr:PIG-L deacetylase family protein [Candidatus Lokiarchaeia archaeon]